MAALSGLWVGSVRGEPVRWALVLASGRPVSAFGCALQAAGGALPTLRGTCEREAVTLRQVAGDGAELGTYAGVVRAGEDGQPVLSGTFTAADAAAEPESSPAEFAVRLEEPSAAHESGIWAGRATPDESVTDCPVNPITWVLSIVRETGDAFGCGFFDDAGDIPNQPLLFYTLRGTADSDGKLALQKVYCPPVPPELTVDYDGTVQEGKISGSWTNALEGTFGSFEARLQRKRRTQPPADAPVAMEALD